MSAQASETWLDRLDDWINPIVVKELRQAVKSRMVIIILMVFLIIELLVMGGILLANDARGPSGGARFSGGIQVFIVLQWVLLPTLMLVIPAHATILFAAERSDQNTDLLFISALTPSQIVWGKFFASAMLAMLVLSLVAPFMVFCYLMRGLDIPTILCVLYFDVLAMVGATMLGLFLAAIPGNRATKAFFSLAGFFNLFGAFMSIGIGTTEFIRSPFAVFDDPVLFWTVLLVPAAVVLPAAGLLYLYTVALISPSSSNRILPIRVYVLCVWAISSLVGYLLIRLLPRFTVIPGDIVTATVVAAFVLYNTVILCAQMSISICERESWGPRVSKTVPQNLLLRGVAFLLYTGSAGGVLFTMLLMGLTVSLGLFWANKHISAGPRREEAELILRCAGGAMLYTVCYGLSGLLVRRYLMGEIIRPGYTWLVSSLLAGLATCVPALVAMIFFQEQLRTGRDNWWWFLPNPMVIGELARHGQGAQADFQLMAWWFLGTWLVLAFVLAVPYLIGQMALFRPLERRPDAPGGPGGRRPEPAGGGRLDASPNAFTTG